MTRPRSSPTNRPVRPSASSSTSTVASTPISDARRSNNSRRRSAGSLIDSSPWGSYLRRPERFFFFRGGGGGAPARLRLPAPTGGGSAGLDRPRSNPASPPPLAPLAPFLSDGGTTAAVD